MKKLFWTVQKIWWKLLLAAVLLLLLAALFQASSAGSRLRRALYGVAPGVYLEEQEISGWLRQEVEDHVRRRAAALKQEPRNAFFDRKTGEIYPEVQGRLVNVRSTVAAAMEAEKDARVPLELVLIDPEITAGMLKQMDQPLGSFATSIGGGGGRAENIRLATKALDYYLVAPGQVFSFNRTVGPTTAERGYKLAPIIVGGRIVPGLGGGICQVATTLYNAVDYSELEVVERYMHSKPVGYVPRGRDATVSYHLDFKFRNSSNRYILIRAWTDYRINITIMTH
jgi:vancomycin resistance protein YoaR